MSTCFPRLRDLTKCSPECYTDAAFINLQNRKSQGGLIIFLQDDYGNRCPILWRSKKIERVVKSSLAEKLKHWLREQNLATMWKEF